MQAAISCEVPHPTPPGHAAFAPWLLEHDLQQGRALELRDHVQPALVGTQRRPIADGHLAVASRPSRALALTRRRLHWSRLLPRVSVSLERRLEEPARAVRCNRARRRRARSRRVQRCAGPPALAVVAAGCALGLRALQHAKELARQRQRGLGLGARKRGFKLRQGDALRLLHASAVVHQHLLCSGEWMVSACECGNEY